MFSSLRYSSKNLARSQRFYYDNFDYYNICENIEKQYKDDLSKFVYHCNRRSVPVIANYGTKQRWPHSRVISIDGQTETMEEFTNRFLDVFMENNYSSATKIYEKEQYLEPFQFLHFSPVLNIRYSKAYCPFKMVFLSEQQLAKCIGDLIDASRAKVQKLEQDYGENQESGILKLSHLQFHFGMELYFDRILTQNYFENVESLSFLLLYEFIIEVHRLMWEIVNSRIRTVLLMAQPKTPLINLLIHPLVLPITTFLKYNNQVINEQLNSQLPQFYKAVSAAQSQKTKIVFINLDGKESSHNLRSLSTLGGSFMYVSIFEEPAWLQKKQTEMEHLFNSDEEGFESSYGNLWKIYSQAIIKEFKLASENTDSKFLLFPLNSTYLQKRYIQKVVVENLTCPQFSSKFAKSIKMPKLESSQDIISLFQQIIYEEIRNFEPTMIFLSYNGTINILEDHFSDIVRNCSIIAHHNVLLFPNFTHLFEPEEFRVDEEEENGDKLLCVHQFYSKYFGYKTLNINEERLYLNFCCFLKYGSGNYCMEDRVLGKPSYKYSIGRFYLYMESLVKLQEFQEMEKYQLKKWASKELEELYGQYQLWERKENKKENKYYEKILSIIVSQLLCRNIDEAKLESILGKRMFYRLKVIIEELAKEQQETIEYVSELISQEAAQSQLQIRQRQPIQKLLEQYLQVQKSKLLSENLENYKTKKYFYLSENQKSFGQISCFRFVLNGGEESEEIYLQKYSQVIVNEEFEEVFIVNYKSPDNRHMILHGSIKNSQIQKDIIVMEVKETDLEMSEEVNEYFIYHELDEEGLINQKQDIVFVQYNYCFYGRTLYLFWPLLWNLREEARCKILSLEYSPKRIHKMIKIFQYQTETQLRYENLLYEPVEENIEVLPRWGCTSVSSNENTFHIFGGVYDNENDYKLIGTGVCAVEIRDNGKCKAYTITPQSKTNKKNQVIACLKPKINYALKRIDDKNEENCIKIFGGYGREGTGFFNLYSCEQYLCNSQFRVTKTGDSKMSRRVVNIEKPLEIDRIGKFNVIQSNYNVSQIEEKFSDVLKDKFIFEKGTEGSGKINEWEILSFIDESYRVNEFKTDPKKLFLFGFDRTIRQKIFMKCWSPEMYIIDGIKECIVNLSLKTEKTSSYIITNYLMPREEDIVSMCLEQDRLFLLSNSPIIHSIDRAGLKFVLYEGALNNMSDVMRKREVQMIAKHNFDEKHERFLNMKSIFVQEEKIYLVGGLCVQQETMGDWKYEREDYILEANKNRYKIKTRRLEMHSVSLDMPNSVIIKENDVFYLYSIVFEEGAVKSEGCEKVEWKVKIEKHTYENSELNQLKAGGFRVYSYNYQNPHKVQKHSHSHLEDPKFVKIEPYVRFSMAVIRQVISKIMWRIDKNEALGKKNDELQSIKSMHEQINDKQLQILLESKWKCFEELISVLRNRSQKITEVTHDEEELLKDLKQAYHLASKMILERHLHLSDPQPNQYFYVVEDKSSKKVKYISVGPLNSTKLNFFRFRFKNELLMNLNQQKDNGLFYHPASSSYFRFEYENMRIGDSTEYQCEETTRSLSVSIKQ